MTAQYKRFILRTSLLLFVLSILAICACRKDSTPPQVTTNEVTDITHNSAICRGTLVSDGNAEISERGFCWSTGPMPTIYDSKLVVEGDEENFSGALPNLAPLTTYWVRSYATNKQGTSYGNILKFWTGPKPGPLAVDADGNVYHSVTIGTQVWMLENLKVRHFNNGDSIHFITYDFDWNFVYPHCCVYGNNMAYMNIYGLLYNWYAVNDSRGIAPAGWHIPTRQEWQVLVDYIGGEWCGGKLRETGFTHWHINTIGSTNETGFTALPGALRDLDGLFDSYRLGSYFWTTSENSASAAWYRGLWYLDIRIANLNCDKLYGFSIRCIKNN